MRFSVFVFPAFIAMACANPIDSSAGEHLFVRDEYRWCLGTILAKLSLPVN